MNITFGSGKPGESTNINIRGAGSITKNNDKPLILIDGVEGSIDNINPRDVESISVLKDASSAAIYGARAAFGVVLVTTKTQNDGTPKISYNGRFSFAKQTTSTDFVTCGYDAATMVDEFLRSYNGSTYTRYSEEDYKRLEERRYDKTENPDRPWVMVENINGIDTYKYYGNFDWYNYLFDDTRPTWDNNISISGGTKALNYMVSANYYTQKGIYAQNSDRYRTGNVRARIKSEVTKWLDFTYTSAMNIYYYKAPGLGDGNNIANYTFHAMPFLLPKNPDGTNVFQTTIIAQQPTDGVHMMVADGESFTKNNRKQYLNTANAVFKIIKGLNLNVNYSYKFTYQDKIHRTNTSTYSPGPGIIKEANSDLLKNKLRQTNYAEHYHVAEAYLSYDNTFKDHTLRLVGGFNYETFFTKNVYSTKLNIQSSTLNDFNLGDNDNVELTGGQKEYALRGFYGRVGYDWKGRYLAEVNLRRDATSRFPSDSRGGWFPSVSLGWRASEEKFFQPLVSVFSNLKIRGSYGALGNQSIPDYYPYIQSLSMKPMDNYIINGESVSYAAVGSPASGNLTWESVYTVNGGIDFGFFDNRLNLTADIYQRDTKGMLMPGKQLPSVYGTSSPYENGAELRTRGFDAVLSWNDSFRLLNKPFSYGVSFTLSDNKTVVTKYSQNKTKDLGSFYEGQVLGEIWGYEVSGLFASDQDAAAYQAKIDQTYVSQNIFVNATGNYKGLRGGDLIYVDRNGDNVINNGINTVDNPGDRKIIGNSRPRYSYSSNLNVSWYGFDASAFFQGIGRQHVYPGSNAMLFWGGFARPFASFVPTTLQNDIWTPENTNAYFPKQRGYAANGNRSLAQVNTRYLQNLAYCRLKNFTLGYTLPVKISEKAKISRCRIYFSGDNLITWTKLRSDYIDPEQFAADRDGRLYPFPKTFSFGVDLTF